MSNKNNRNHLLNRSIFVSVLVAFFVLVGLVGSATAASGEVLVLHFDEGSGTIAKDASGHGNDGTIYGATWTTGISGKALSFDGVDDYVDCGNDASLNIIGDMSIEAWVYYSGSGDVDIINKVKFANGYGTYALGFENTKQTFVQSSDGSTWVTLIQVSNSYSIGWHHIAGTNDGTTARLYVDGVMIGTDTSPATSLVTIEEHVKIGEYKRRADYRHFNGIIDEVAVYSKALTPEEIKAHYNAKRAGGSTEESTSELINSVSTCIDALKRNNIDTLLIEQSLENAQDAYDSGNHDEAYELAQNAQKMADDAYEAQQHIESAESEIDGAKSIGAEVKEAEAKLKEAKDALNKGNYEYAQDWADDASELAKHASIGSVRINDLKALATKYDQRTVVISGTIRDIETVYGEGYTFALDDSSGMISVTYQGSLGDIKDGDKVTASGIFEASTGTLVADTVQKSGVGGGGVPGFEVIFAIAGLLVVAYLRRRSK